MTSENSRLITPKLIQCRKTPFGYFNPREWNFSIVNLIHMIRNISAYLTYFLYHKASKPSKEDLEKYLPKADERLLDKLKEPPPKGIQVLWIGHASLLVQIDGFNILFDPVFYDCGPCLWGKLLFGYKRFRQPAVTVDDLKNKHGIEVHAVFISHNHYDHLDLRSVQDLVKAYGDDINWFVPKGMRQWFGDRGCSSIQDLDWWENGVSIPALKVTFTPAKHWSLRGLRHYYCRHLWGSWFIRGPHGSTFFFAGDTGYVDDTFSTIKRECGVPDVAAIPIGAYRPRPVMKAQHIDPEEALKIHIELEAKHSIGIHWGTFAMSNEKINEPREDLRSAKEKMRCNLEKREKQARLEDFIVLDHGEVRTFSTAEQ